MLAQGNYLERLICSLIKPIYKSGDKSSPSNYIKVEINPLHLTIDPFPYCLNFLKFLKKSYIKGNLITWTIMKYWMNTNLAFEEVSTENASHTLLNEILEAMNSKQMVGGIFCDLRKAFDCVNHDELLEKLKFYWVSGKFYNLVKSYLNGRYQKYRISRLISGTFFPEKVT